MTTTTIIDYRRTDLRTNVLENPYWITSGLVSVVDSEDKAALLFSFPTAGQIIFVEQVVCQIVTLCAGGTVTVCISSGTLATDAVTTGGVVTETAVDTFITTADITVGTAGRYAPTTANTSAWLTAKIAGSFTTPYKIAGAASTVPCVYATCLSSTTATAGTLRVHMLISICP